MHFNLAKSSRFESTDFASVMIDGVGCIRHHQGPQYATNLFIFSHYPLLSTKRAVVHGINSRLDAQYK